MNSLQRFVKLSLTEMAYISRTLVEHIRLDIFLAFD